MRITILGGAGEMGGWFARFFKENNCTVRIVDITEKTELVAKELGVQFSTADILKLSEGALKEEFADTDIVLVSVPIDITGRGDRACGPCIA